MKLSASTKLSEIDLPYLLMFIEEAFNLAVYVSGDTDSSALSWTLKDLSEKSKHSIEDTIRKVSALIEDFKDLEVNAEDLKITEDYLLDIRERWEWDTCHLEGSNFIADIDFPKELELMKKRKCIVICHHGVRSLSGALYLRSLGVKAYSLKGGLEYWSKNIDSSLKRY